MKGFPKFSPSAVRTSSVRLTYIQLFAFSTDAQFVSRMVAAGAAGVVVDWEFRGKHRRQAGADTQINSDTPADLSRVRAATTGKVLCRVNGWHEHSAEEIDTAIERGADEILLPMVRTPDEVDAAVAAVAGRCHLGILIETGDAVRHAAELVARPLSRVYVGLNDLMIDGGGTCLFAPLADGTVDEVRAAVGAANVAFGVAGLTLPDKGWPVPCRLLMGELARLDVSFTFLRRSFRADIAGRHPAVEVPQMTRAIAAARHRTPAQVAADHEEFRGAIGVNLTGVKAAV